MDVHRKTAEQAEGPCSSKALTCKTVVHFRGLVVIVVVSRHYPGVLHVIVGLGALGGGLL